MNTKKVLILGNYWPHVRGGHRISPLLRNLSSYGYDPILITMWPKEMPKLKPCDEYSIIYADELNLENVFKYLFDKLRILNFLKKNSIESEPQFDTKQKRRSSLLIYTSYALGRIRKFIASLLFIPDEYNLSLFRIKRLANEFLKDNKVDLILTEFPNIFHLAGSSISKKYSLPWIADFVDPWADNFNYPHGFFRQKLDRFIQKSSLSSAAAVVTVSPVWQENNLFYNSNSLCIEHSFREELPPKNEPLEKINILYAGRIYPEIQDHKLFFKLLKNYLNKVPKLEDMLKVKFVGEGANEDMLRLSDSFGLGGCIEIGSRVDPKTLSCLKEDADLLMIYCTNSSKDGWYTSKLFDYIGANRPILAMGHNENNIIADFILENNLGYFVHDDHTFSKLFDDMIRRVEHSMQFHNLSSEAFVSSFHESKMTERFTRLFDTVIEEYE